MGWLSAHRRTSLPAIPDAAQSRLVSHKVSVSRNNLTFSCSSSAKQRTTARIKLSKRSNNNLAVSVIRHGFARRARRSKLPCEQFSQGSPSENHSQYVEHRLRGKQNRLVLYVFFARYEMCLGMWCRLHQFPFLTPLPKREKALLTRKPDRSVELDENTCQRGMKRQSPQVPGLKAFGDCVRSLSWPSCRRFSDRSNEPG